MAEQLKEKFVSEVIKTICKGESKGKFANKPYTVERINPIESTIYYGGYAFCMVGDNLFQTGGNSVSNHIDIDTKDLGYIRLFLRIYKIASDQR